MRKRGLLKKLSDCLVCVRDININNSLIFFLAPKKQNDDFYTFCV